MTNDEILRRVATIDKLRDDLSTVGRRCSEARERGVSADRMDYDELGRLTTEHAMAMRAGFLKRERGL